MKRAFTNILTGDVEGTSAFYEHLLGMNRRGDFGWFVVLGHPELTGFELGILDKAHETLKPNTATAQGGIILTFVVEDVEAVYAQSRSMGVTILQEPTDMFYGQRRLLLSDPAGTTVDISAPIT
ncbi:MAG: VOC family protein [Pseudomonadota bacterium]